MGPAVPAGQPDVKKHHYLLVDGTARRPLPRPPTYSTNAWHLIHIIDGLLANTRLRNAL